MPPLTPPKKNASGYVSHYKKAKDSDVLVMVDADGTPINRSDVRKYMNLLSTAKTLGFPDRQSMLRAYETGALTDEMIAQAVVNKRQKGNTSYRRQPKVEGDVFQIDRAVVESMIAAKMQEFGEWANAADLMPGDKANLRVLCEHYVNRAVINTKITDLVHASVTNNANLISLLRNEVIKISEDIRKLEQQIGVDIKTRLDRADSLEAADVFTDALRANKQWISEFITYPECCGRRLGWGSAFFESPDNVMRLTCPVCKQVTVFPLKVVGMDWDYTQKDVDIGGPVVTYVEQTKGSW